MKDPPTGAVRPGAAAAQVRASFPEPSARRAKEPGAVQAVAPRVGVPGPPKAPCRAQAPARVAGKAIEEGGAEAAAAPNREGAGVPDAERGGHAVRPARRAGLVGQGQGAVPAPTVVAPAARHVPRRVPEGAGVGDLDASPIARRARRPTPGQGVARPTGGALSLAGSSPATIAATTNAPLAVRAAATGGGGATGAVAAPTTSVVQASLPGTAVAGARPRTGGCLDLDGIRPATIAGATGAPARLATSVPEPDGAADPAVR